MLHGPFMDFRPRAFQYFYPWKSQTFKLAVANRLEIHERIIEKPSDLLHPNFRLFQGRKAPAFVRHKIFTAMEARLLVFATPFTAPLEWAINKDREALNQNLQVSEIVKRYLYADMLFYKAWSSEHGYLPGYSSQESLGGGHREDPYCHLHGKDGIKGA